MVLDQGPEPAVEEPPKRSIEPCACRVCRRADPRDEKKIEEHAFYHGEFSVFLAARNGSHGFTEPTAAQIADMKLGEFFAAPLSGQCDWPEHSTFPAHPRTH